MQSIKNGLIVYLFSGGIVLNASEFRFAFSKSFGLKMGWVEAGCLSISFCGLIGRSTKLPEQLGHTFSNISMAQVLQYVHSKEQIMAFVEVLGKALLQCSQFGLRSNIL